ncbi:hypothetical protein HID58_028677, partial [Brassica napus]
AAIKEIRFCSSPDGARWRVPATGGSPFSLNRSSSLCYRVVPLTLSALSIALLLEAPDTAFTAGKLRSQWDSARCWSIDARWVWVSIVVVGFWVWVFSSLASGVELFLFFLSSASCCGGEAIFGSRSVTGLPLCHPVGACTYELLLCGCYLLRELVCAVKVWRLSSVVHGCSLFFSENCSIFVCPSHFAVPRCSASPRFRASSLRFLGSLDSLSTVSSSRRKRVKSRFSARCKALDMKNESQCCLITCLCSGSADGLWSSVLPFGASASRMVFVLLWLVWSGGIMVVSRAQYMHSCSLASVMVFLRQWLPRSGGLFGLVAHLL